jgi:hypothetical protein
MEDILLDGEPRLMPMQGYPTNGDYHVCNEFIKLRDKFNVKKIIECGSCCGGTSKWFGENFEEVITIEINETFRNVCLRRINGLPNVQSILGDSVNHLPNILSNSKNNIIIFLDDHWLGAFPLIDELKIIKQSGLIPIIVVHDCFVPNEPNLGYDSYDGVSISYETMKPYLDEIYGVDRYSYHYNSDTQSTQVKRGVFYCYPKIDTLDRGYLFMK